jgi:hypothetical protein
LRWKWLTLVAGTRTEKMRRFPHIIAQEESRTRSLN